MSTNAANTTKAPVDFVQGDATGLAIPAHIDALRSGGEAFLTNAFRAFGSIAANNRVERIMRCEICPGGSTGQKLFLSVEYARPEPQLHTDLFVKFSRDFTDPIRDARGKHEMEGEVRLAALSRLPGFPIKIPTAYFADYHHESKTGLLITEQVAFGVDGIEPHRKKCMDHEIAQPIVYYRTIVRSLARIAAAHRSGRLSADIEAQFPFDPRAAAASNPIPYDEAQLRSRVASFAEFVARYPRLFPPNIGPELFSRLDREAVRFLRHEATINRFLQSNPDLIALCHWNANIDNAWFWRDESGALHCGLMDWGHAGQMNVAFSLWGSLSAASLDVWDHHLEELLTLFVDELRVNGGPRLDIEELRLHLELYAGLMGFAYFVESPARILFRLPEAVNASGPRDPIFQTSETARNQLHISTVVLNLWRTHDIGAGLDRVLDRMRGAAGQVPR
jgi:hypothetical protein